MTRPPRASDFARKIVTQDAAKNVRSAISTATLLQEAAVTVEDADRYGRVVDYLTQALDGFLDATTKDGP